jgi:predicted lipoprotein
MKTPSAICLLGFAALVAVFPPVFQSQGGVASPAFSKQAMLSNMVHGVVIPAGRAFQSSCAALETEARAFTQQPDAASLAPVRAAWRAAMLAWKHQQTFQFGPAADTGAHSRINYWPPRRASMDRVMADARPMDAAFMEQLGSTVLGLGAIERLLFDAAAGDEALLKGFSGETGARRREYLVALTQDLTRQATRCVEAWESGAEHFLAGGQDSLNLMVNVMIAGVELYGQIPLRQHIGFFNSKLVQPDFFECGHSGLSREALLAVLRGAHELYRGGEGPGLDDQLRQAGADAVEKSVTAAFTAALESVEKLEGSILDALKQDKAAVEEAEAACRRLELSLKLETPSALGVFLTFRSADGD